MKYHAFYVNNTLLIRIKKAQTTSYDMKNNIAVLYHNNDIIGYNIFKFDYNKSGLLKLNEQLHNQINLMLGEEKLPLLDLDESNYLQVGKIISIVKHPDSNKLNILEVSFQSETVQIVCGAANVALNQKVVVARPGCVLYDGTWITKGKVMNVKSDGMVCSARELGLQQKEPGILVLDNSYQEGAVFDVENC